jgi:superoxide dismutase, Fe-Mn family
MNYESKELPFDKELDGISKKTIEIHHDKLYEGYVKKMKEIGGELGKFAHGEKELSGNQTYSELRALRMGETFATNGVYLHEYYFNSLGGDGNVPENALTEAIKAKWDSMENFVNYFSASGMAMRGWVVLSWDTQLGRLKVYGCDSHNQGGVWGCIPLIVLDVYEHAYFLDYGSDRKAYITDFWKNMNWDATNALFEKVNTINLK